MNQRSRNLNWNTHTLHFSLALGSIDNTVEASVFDALDNLRMYAGASHVYLFKTIDLLTAEVVASTAKDKIGLISPLSLYEQAVVQGIPVFYNVVDPDSPPAEFLGKTQNICFLPFSLSGFKGCMIVSWQETSIDFSPEFELFIHIAHIRFKELLNYSGIISELNATKERLGTAKSDLTSVQKSNHKLSRALDENIVITKELQSSIDELQARSEEVDSLNRMLKGENELMYSVFNNSRDAFIIANSMDSEILDCNDTALDFFDTDDKKNIVGKRCSSFFYDHVAHMEILKMINNPTKSFKYRLKTVSGGVFWGNISCKLVYRQNDAFRLIIISDITPCVNKKNEEIQAVPLLI